MKPRTFVSNFVGRAPLFHADDVADVLRFAADEIWHSMQKFDGDPTQRNPHPVNCGCTYCN